MTALAWLGCGLLTAFVLCVEACLDQDRRNLRLARRRLRARDAKRRSSGGYRPTQRVELSGSRPFSGPSAITPPRGSSGVPRRPWIGSSAQLDARRSVPPPPNPTRPHARKDG